VHIFSSPQPTPSLPGFTTWTITARSDVPGERILAMDFAGVRENDDPATGRGFFSLLPNLHQVNPNGVPTVSSDLNALFPAFGASAEHDSQFLIKTGEVIWLPTHAEESNRHLQAAWSWLDPPGESVDFAQLVLPNFQEFSFRGVVTLQLSTGLTEVNVSGQIFIESPLIPTDVDLGDRHRGSIIAHQFAVSSSPVTSRGATSWLLALALLRFRRH
jgi:hypothetical protein